jgi:Fic/DOC family
VTGEAGSVNAKNLPPPDPYGQLRRSGEPGASYSQLSIEAKRGAAVRLSPGLYVVGSTLPVEQVVRHHALSIVSGVWPGGVLCARTAFAGGIPIDGKLFVIPADVSQRRQPMTLPGLTIVSVEGPPSLPGDMTMPGGLFLSGTARGLVENVSVRGRPARWRAGTAAVEDKIDELARTGGAGRIQAVLDQLDVITGSFDPAPVALVRSRLAAVLGSFFSSAGVPKSARLAARLSGVPFDAHRITMLADLVTTLENTAPRPFHLSPPISRWEWLPFFESYFSNFIEGTEFGVEEARLIAVDGVVPEARSADAHDVAATYRLAIDPVERGRVPRSGEELVDILRERHATLMAARPDRAPGELKTMRNFAGGFEFVQPELVIGTLERGFEEIGRLVDPFARAVATMVLVTECHPFIDGNGRVARLAMNAELSAAGQVRICLPTVFRPEYLSALVGYSGGAGHGQSLVSVLTYAQRWTAEIDWSSFSGANHQVAACNGFVDPDVASRTGQRLLLASSLPIEASNESLSSSAE